MVNGERRIEKTVLPFTIYHLPFTTFSLLPCLALAFPHVREGEREVWIEDGCAPRGRVELFEHGPAGVEFHEGNAAERGRAGVGRRAGEVRRHAGARRGGSRARARHRVPARPGTRGRAGRLRRLAQERAERRARGEGRVRRL